VLPALVGVPLVVNAQSPSARYHLHIAAQPLSAALMEFASETGLQVARFSEADHDALTIKGLFGEFTASQALDQMLAGTGLEYRFVNDRTIAIVRSPPTRIAPQPAAPPAIPPTTDSDSAPMLGSRQPRKGLLNWLAGVFASCALASASTPACAQAGSSADNSNALDEIVVTATRRSENLQNTAMSISALNGADLQQRDISSMSDYLNSIPSIAHLDIGIGRDATVIRGISLGPQDEGTSSGQPIGYYFGEVPLSNLSWSPPDIKLVDMERVEVLRGPQGTLYGAGALAGAVRNVPVAPQLDGVHAYVEVGDSYTARLGGNNYEYQGMLNLPLVSDTLALRLVAYNFNNSGYVDNVAHSNAPFLANAQSYGVGALAIDQTNVGNDSYSGGRISALWRPIDGLNVTLSYLTQNAVQNGFPEEQLGLGLYQQTRLQMGAPLSGSEFLGSKVDVGNIEVTYDLPWASLVSSSSYSQQDFHRHYGIDYYFGGVPVPQQYDTKETGYNQEIRLVSKLEGPWKFLVGLYYQRLKFFDGGNDYYTGAAADNPYASADLYSFTDLTHLEQKAIFGEVAYTIGNRTTITLGARDSDYSKRTIDYSAGALAGAASTTEVNGSQNKPTFKANISYKASDQVMVYGEFAQGFRFGKPVAPYPSICNDGTGHVVGTDVPINGGFLKSDSVNSFELGEKAELLDKRLTVNSDVYYIQWKNLPISVIASCQFPIDESAGKAQSKGVEFEAKLLIVEGLRVDFSGSLLKAQLVGDNPGIGAGGARLPGSPEHQYSVGLQYAFALMNLPGYLRTDYVRLGSFHTDVQNLGPEVGDYGQLNARLGLTVGQIDIGLFGTNLTNSAALAWYDAEFENGRADRLRPRTMGADLKFRFH
jgi:outer membrane receptor protein involved in Fe transport